MEIDTRLWRKEVDAFYSGLCELYAVKDGETQEAFFKELRRISEMSPSKKNLYKVIDLIKATSAAHTQPTLANLLWIGLSIMEGKYDKEFRYRYGGVPASGVSNYGKVSSTSELFSLIRQALKQ